ncbi:MAG TPA: M15 family metallopeptidase, partial [Acidimicrobiales bacterium]|nr:M15 family metallopeptidase [Acidimicrobiales bacterium]
RTGDRDGGGGGAGATKGLAPAMRAALARAEQLLGRAVPITSGYRSTEQQAALYDSRASNPFPVAAPGSSMHERGLAIDVPADFVPTLLGVAAKAGLCQPYPSDDPIHFEVCR